MKNVQTLLADHGVTFTGGNSRGTDFSIAFSQPRMEGQSSNRAASAEGQTISANKNKLIQVVVNCCKILWTL